MCLARFWKASYFSFREKKKIVCGSSLSKLQFGVKETARSHTDVRMRLCIVGSVLRRCQAVCSSGFLSRFQVNHFLQLCSLVGGWHLHFVRILHVWTVDHAEHSHCWPVFKV